MKSTLIYLNLYGLEAVRRKGQGQKQPKNTKNAFFVRYHYLSKIVYMYFKNYFILHTKIHCTVLKGHVSSQPDIFVAVLYSMHT